MKIVLSIILAIALITGYSWYKNKSSAVCKSSETSTPYCKYIGPINKLYLNSDGLVLVYLDANFSQESAEKFGYQIASGNIVAFNIYENAAYTQFYESLLLIINEEFHIELHARNTESGYMKLDRFWFTK